MGYTHYWYRKPKLDANNWDAFLLDVDKLIRNSGITVQYEADDAKPPEVSAQLVRFNGVDGDGHETFYIEREATGRDRDGQVFAFCKTAQKPYDPLVCAVLVAAKKHFGADFKVSSDGDQTDWEEGLDLVDRLLGYTAKWIGEGNDRDIEVS
jgi:hypothetical protein